MANSKSNQRTRYYSDFAGVDLSSSPGNIRANRFADMKNMYRDYYGGDGSAVESVPGFRRLYSFSSPEQRRKINSLLQFSPYWDEGEYIAVHAGKNLFLYPIESKDTAEEQPLSPVMLYKDGAAYAVAELEDEKSVMLESDGVLYVLDGKSYFRLDEHGLQDVRDIPYVPTTYSDAKPYEQKNLLTRDFYCRFNLSESIHSINRYHLASEGLIYRITDENTCEVTGINDADVKNLYVPAQTEIDGKIYYVEGIAPLSFRGLTSLSTVSVADGVKKIGENAFLNCTSLISASLPDTLEELGTGAFLSCSKLQCVTLGTRISEIPRNAFYETALSIVLFSGEAYDWDMIKKNEYNPNFSDVSLTYNNRNYLGEFCFYVNERCEHIYSVTLDERELSTASDDVYYTPVYEKRDGSILISAIIVKVSDYTTLYGKTLTIHGRSDNRSSTVGADVKPFDTQKDESTYDVISACTLCVKFDGRIFYSGNEKYPSTIFYSARDSSGENSPLYVGSLNYFHVGREDSPVSSLLALGDSLVIFKDGGERGGVYVYSGADTSSDLLPRIYTLTEYVGGVGSVGASCSFYGDTVFLSERGLDALSKKQLNGELSVCHRSSNIDSALLRGSLEDCSICCWQGYLCILRDGEIFLADSRRTFSHSAGDTQYEWYRMSDVGTYENQYSRFFTLPLSGHYFDLYVKYGEAYMPLEGREESTDDCDGAFMTYAYRLEDGEFKESGLRVFCCVIPDSAGIFHCYMCDSSGEMKGGNYYPATHLLCARDVLFFGTAGGDLCCFNTDKRDENGNIDRHYYTFNGRRYFSGFSTKSDNCDVPSMTKSTVKHSLCLHLKGFGSGRIKVSVRTDQDTWRQIADAQNSVFAFDDIEFDRFTFNTSSRTTLVLPEKEKRWSEKQYNVYSDEYMRPFGIFDISYRYKVAGRIKDK